MSYRDNDDKGTGGFWKTAGGLLAGVLAFAVAKTVTHSGFDFLQRSTTTDSKVEQILEGDARFGPTFHLMKERFPNEYHDLTADLAQVIRSGATNDQIAVRAHGAMREFLKKHVREITSAPDDLLVQIATIPAGVADNLSNESKSMCAEFGMTGIRPGADMSDSTVRLLAENARLMVVAAHEGATNPIQRQTSELSDSDSVEFVDALRKQGMTDRQLQIFATDGAMARASVIDQCEITVEMYDAVPQLPRPVAARVFAMMLVQSEA